MLVADEKELCMLAVLGSQLPGPMTAFQVWSIAASASSNHVVRLLRFRNFFSRILGGKPSRGFEVNKELNLQARPPKIGETTLGLRVIECNDHVLKLETEDKLRKAMVYVAMSRDQMTTNIIISGIGKGVVGCAFMTLSGKIFEGPIVDQMVERFKNYGLTLTTRL